MAPVPRTSPEERAALRRELGLPPGAVVFGILARLEEYKGHLDLIRAARLLKDRGADNFRSWWPGRLLRGGGGPGRPGGGGVRPGALLASCPTWLAC